MINITVIKSSKQYRGFCFHGHAGYVLDGEDIICAAVSALSLNTVNSIEVFTNDKFEVQMEDGLLEFNFTSDVSLESNLLMDSLILGINNIIKDNNGQYIQLEIKEV